MNRIPVCISSVYQREPDIMSLRAIARRVINEHLFLECIRNPEDVKTQKEFEKTIRECFAFVLILGTEKSSVVERELELAIKANVHIMPFLKLVVSEGSITGSPNGKKLLQRHQWDFDQNKIYFKDADDFESILHQQMLTLIQIHLSPRGHIYTNRVDMFDNLTEIITRATRFLAIAQRHPTVFLGPKRGDHRDARFADAFCQMLDRIRQGKLERFTLIFSDQHMNTAISRPDIYGDMQDWFWSLEEKFHGLSHNQVSIRMLPDSFQSFIFADNTFCYKLQIGNILRYLILPEDQINNLHLTQLTGDIETMGSLMTCADVVERYGNIITQQAGLPK